MSHVAPRRACNIEKSFINQQPAALPLCVHARVCLHWSRYESVSLQAEGKRFTDVKGNVKMLCVKKKEACSKEEEEEEEVAFMI